MRKLALAGRSMLVLSLVLLLASCAFLTPIQTSAPETNDPPASPGSLAALRMLLTEANPSAVKCTVIYTDPAVGVPLHAETSLSFDGETGSLSFRYEKPNLIGTAEFVSEVSGSAFGDLTALSAALSGAASWVWDATVGVSLPDLCLQDAFLATAEITPSGTDGYLLTATPTEGNAGALVGLAFADASELTLQICFSDDAVTLVVLHYTLGGASYSVASTFSYSK